MPSAVESLDAEGGLSAVFTARLNRAGRQSGYSTMA